MAAPPYTVDNKGPTHTEAPMAVPAVSGHMYESAVPLQTLTSSPTPVDCPMCHTRQMTRVEFKAGSVTHLWALGLCIFTGLCCIPYCISGTKDAAHYCAHCGVHLATWRRNGSTEVHAYS